MKYFIIIFSIIGLSNTGFTQQTINSSINHNGMQRDYILYVPASYTGNKSVPLVFNFHGYNSTANGQMWYGDFRSIADTAGFIIVHPMGTKDSSGITHFNVEWGGSSTDDVGFSAALLDSIASEYNIDSTRVYSTGMSNGGYMSYYLACQLSEKFAAIASVTGSMTPLQYNNCDPQHPTPILHIHGTSDNTVPYNGDSWTESIDDVLQYWINYNNCNTTAMTTSLLDIDSTDGSTVEHIIYDGGSNGVAIDHFKVIGGAHTWPGTALGGAGTNYDMDASTEIWKFFLKYNINGLIGTTTGLGQLSKQYLGVSIYPNPTNEIIYINTNDSNEVDTHIRVYDILGKVLYEESVNNGKAIVDLSNQNSGVFLINIQTDQAMESFKILLAK